MNKLKPRAGVIGIADDLLPRYKGKSLVEPPVVHRLQTYWANEKRTELVRLAHLLQLDKFIKIASDENEQRLLESLWRAARGNFVFKDRLRPLDDCISVVEGEILPVLETASTLERRAKDVLQVTGIEFEESETLVKASGGFRQLGEMLKEFRGAVGAAPQRAVYELYGSSLDVSKYVRTLNTQIEAAQRAISRLEQSAQNLRKNYWEYTDAVAYLELSEDALASIVLREMNVGTTCTLPTLVQEATSRADKLDEMNGALKHLHERLTALDDALRLVGEEEGAA